MRHDNRRLLASGLASAYAETGYGGVVDPVVQSALRLQPALDHLLGWRADLGAIELAGMIVGALPVCET